MLAKFGWALVRKFDPVHYAFCKSVIRDVARQAVEQVSPSDTPTHKGLGANHSQMSLKWPLDNQLNDPDRSNQKATTRG